MSKPLTVGELTIHLSRKYGEPYPMWKIRRLVDAISPDLPRFAGVRQVPAELIPAIEQEMKTRGYIPSTDEVSA